MAKDSNRRDVVTQPDLLRRNASKESRLSLKTPEEMTHQSEVDDGPLTVGAQLRDAREAKGLSLHQVADILRLRASQVHALEEGDFSSLPGQTFVTGFLRSYANLLDLDAVAIVELYKNEEGGGLHTPSLAFPEPSTGGRIPGAGILLGTIVVALILLAGWFVYQESESLDFERVAELPEHLASKIKDINVGDTTNASDVPNQNNSGQIQTSGTDVSTVAPIEAPEMKSGESVTSDTNGDVNVTTDVEGAPREDAPVVTSENVDTAGSMDTMQIDNASSAISPESAATSATDSETTDTASNEKVVTTERDAGSDTVLAAQQASPTEESASTTMSETAEMTADETAVQTAEISTDYPQDTLDTEAPTQTAAAETPENPLPRTFGVENTDARVVVRATEESWVEVKATDDKPVLSRVLKPGDIYMAPNDPNLFLTTGNAGGLEIRVDGQEIKSLGGTGTILREVPLVAESLLQGGGLQ